MVTSDSEKKEIGQKFISGLRTGDWELLRSLMTADIVWSLPGSSLISGTANVEGK
jgi:uncharacterized protein